MSERPAGSEHPDYQPDGNPPAQRPEDDETSAPESGDKQPE